MVFHLTILGAKLSGHTRSILPIHDSRWKTAYSFTSVDDIKRYRGTEAPQKLVSGLLP